jgi:hypothetical protein
MQAGARRDAGLLSNWKGPTDIYACENRTQKQARIAPADASWSQCELTGGWRTIVMEPLEMERRNWFHVRNEPKRLDGRRSQLRHSRRRDPFESIVVEALAVLDLQT